jgi:hypothetical protein
MADQAGMMIVAVSPATDEARELIRELDLDIATLYPGLPINGIDAAEFESAGGYFVIPREAGEGSAGVTPEVFGLGPKTSRR